MSARTHKYSVIFIISAISLLFQFKTLNQFPQYIHNWAQCDRYALALGFMDNGGDLFHPQTYVLNNQFPGEFMIPRNTTITSVDFPIHDYIVSFIMRIAHSTEPWCFRLYTLLYAIIGLYFLYRLVVLFTGSITRALFVVLFALSSPVFLYYEAGFLPTIPSLANCLIGVYYFFNYIHTNRRKFFYVAILFISLAAMARLPFAIILVAMSCFESYQVYKNKRVAFFKLIGFAMSILCIGGYYVYNNHLRQQYGSLFLNYIIPASTAHELLDFTKTSIKKWGADYFNALAYAMFAISAFVFAFNLLKRNISLTNLERQFVFFMLIICIGCGLYYLLMTYQFMNHDYYFLDTFYIPVVGLFLFFVVKWPAMESLPKMKKWSALSLIIFIPVFLLSKSALDKRIGLFSLSERSTAESYAGAAKFLDSLHIPANARILVFCSDGSNNAFVLMRRKGYVIIEPTKEKIEIALNWPYDYIVADDNKFLSAVYGNYPEIIHRLVEIGGNGFISVYKKTNAINDSVTETAFFGLDKKPVVLYDQQHLKSIQAPLTDLKNQDVIYELIANNLDSATEYGYTFKVRNDEVLNKPNRLLKVTFHFECHKNMKELLMCASVETSGKSLYFGAKDMVAKIQKEGWQEYTALYVLPQVMESNYELKVFIWNRGKNNLSYDDFQITIY